MDGDQGVTSNSFKSPLATLLSSLSDDHDITQHDISQAYALFYTRIKSLATLNGLADAPLSPDLLHLRSHAPELALCLKRDVERALQDTGSTVRYLAAVSEDKYRYLRQEAQVAQNAIRVASALFGSASLSSLFLGAFRLVGPASVKLKGWRSARFGSHAGRGVGGASGLCGIDSWRVQDALACTLCPNCTAHSGGHRTKETASACLDIY
ncbi:hypothetical protein BC835DRAFT_1086067 [Cytidiella melzeri]|nr:hypothetical protein BC835DRAFT_1086067 [Cytidiella melzeri]